MYFFYLFIMNIYFLHLGIPPTPLPELTNHRSTLWPPAANQGQASMWVTDSGEVKGERSQRQRSAAAVPRQATLVCVCVFVLLYLLGLPGLKLKLILPYLSNQYSP